MPPSSRARPLDPWLLEALHQSFTARAGPDSRLDLEALKRSFGIRSAFLAERMLTLFDRDGDGRLDRNEVLKGVRRLLFGSTSGKLALAFQIHDLDGDGVLSRQELVRMIALGLEEEASTGDSREQDESPASIQAAAESIRRNAESLADMLLEVADRSGDQRLCRDEFQGVVHQYPRIFKLIARSEAQWLDAPTGLFARPRDERGSWARALRFLDNHVPLVVGVALWAGVNAALFLTAVEAYAAAGFWVQLARGCGACLNFNGALVFVPVMRHVIDWVRRVPIARWLPIDDALFFHRLIGRALFGFSLVHTAAHLTNYALHSPLGVWGSLSGTSAGQTGLALLVVTVVMWALALPAIRRTGHFEVFWFSHVAYVGWAALALLHGPVFWKWALVPLVAFALQKLAQKVGARRTTIQGMHTLRSGVTRLEIVKPPGFVHAPGDYVRLRVPALARFEWHPFTISSAPERELLTLHVRRLGNWTGALRALAKRRNASGDQSPLVAYIDGPYGTASRRIFTSRYAILVGAGIGVTPFASVLDSLIHREKRGEGPLENAYFYWLNRDPYSFEWFAGLLLKLEASDERQKVDIHVYMTGGQCSVTAAALNVAREVAHALGKPDLVTGLRTQTHLGQPDWDQELATIARRHAPEQVDLFFCGPPGLARKLRGACRKAGVAFFQEHF